MSLNGDLDTTFGSSGFFTFNSENKPDYSYSFTIYNGDLYISHVRLDDTNNIANSVLKISTTGSMLNSSTLYWGLFRGRDILVDSTGNIFVGGYLCRDANLDGTCDNIFNPDFDFGIGKFNSSLVLVNSKVYSLSDSFRGYSLALQPDGKLLLGGYSKRNGGEFALIRVNSSDLELDNTFNSTGIFTWDLLMINRMKLIPFLFYQLEIS